MVPTAIGRSRADQSVTATLKRPAVSTKPQQAAVWTSEIHPSERHDKPFLPKSRAATNELLILNDRSYRLDDLNIVLPRSV